MNCRKHEIKCQMCYGVGSDGFSDPSVGCRLCRGKPLSKAREAAFRMLLPTGVMFWAGGGPILSRGQFFEIIDKLGDVGLRK